MTLLGFTGLKEKIKSIAAFSHRVAASTPYIFPPVLGWTKGINSVCVKAVGRKKMLWAN